MTQQRLAKLLVNQFECHLRLGGTTQETIDHLINRPFLEGQIFNLIQRQPVIQTTEEPMPEKITLEATVERAFPPPPDLPLVEHLDNPRKLTTYVNTLSGEILGWIIYPTKRCFSPVQRVHSDPVNGPVVVIEAENGWDVFEIDCDQVAVYGTDMRAMAVYFGD